MGQRIDIVTAARITRRSESTWRAWLSEEPCPITVVEGVPHGGRKGVPGRKRWLDVDEVKALHLARGGSSWHPDLLPEADTEALRAEVTSLDRRLTEVVAAMEALQREVRLHRSQTLRSSATSANSDASISREWLEPPIMAQVANGKSDATASPSWSGPYPLATPHPPKQPYKKPPSPLEPKPDELYSWAEVAKEHDLPRRTVRAANDKGKIRLKVEPTGKGWKLPHGRVVKVYDYEALNDFHRYFAKRLGTPCRKCGFIVTVG